MRPFLAMIMVLGGTAGVGGWVGGYYVAGGAGGVAGAVVAAGGAGVGVAHDVLEVAEGAAGVEVQRGDRVAHGLRAEAAGQFVGQGGARGEASYNPPHVGGEQPVP